MAIKNEGRDWVWTDGPNTDGEVSDSQAMRYRRDWELDAMPDLDGTGVRGVEWQLVRSQDAHNQKL